MTFFRHLDRHGHWDDRETVRRIAYAAAQRLDDQAAQVHVLRSAGILSCAEAPAQRNAANLGKLLRLYTAPR
jgi:hypothetical protein